MRAGLWVAAAILLLGTGVGHAMTDAERAAARTELLARAVKLVEASQDAYYVKADSGSLGWGESYVLESYLRLYRVTGDVEWLRRVAKHADVVLANATPGRDGRLGWRTAYYSVALATLTPQGAAEPTLQLDAERIYDIKRAQAVTGHRYRLVCRRPGRLQVIDTSAPEALPAEVECSTEHDFEVAPGIELRCDALPQPGMAWLLATTKAAPLEYVVHDGMVLQPISAFCRIVLADRPRFPELVPAATRYLDLMERELVGKWEVWWRDFSPRTGAYLAQDDPAQRFPGIVLPHNQYTALGRAIVNLYLTTKKPLYLDRLTKMANFLKDQVRPVGDHYEWNYWDPGRPADEPGKRMQVTEDTSHANINVGFMLDCAAAGVVFTGDDVKRLQATLRAMRGTDAGRPTIGDRVGSAKGDNSGVLDWLRLAAGDDELTDWAITYARQRLTTGGGSAAAALAAVAGLVAEP